MKNNIWFRRGIKSLLFACALISSITVFAQDETMTTPIHFQQKDPELGHIIEIMEQKLSKYFSYDPRNIPLNVKINLPAEQVTLQVIFDLLKIYGIQAIIKGNVIILQKVNDNKQTKAVIRGTVTDGSTGELLPDVLIVIEGQPGSITTNQYGFYSLSGSGSEARKVSVRHSGYVTSTFQFHFKYDTVANISLLPDTIILDELTIIANNMSGDTHLQTEPGNITLGVQKIKETASFAGEPDALKALQFLPGVQSGNEGTTNLSVRGGSFDQNLYLLDDASIYNPAHALGFFSVFNADALQSVTLHKGPIPVNYGGRLSSVVDVRMKEGNRVKRSTSGYIGVIASGLTVDGPVSKKSDKASFMLSGRYSYAGRVLNGIYLLGSTFFNDWTANRTADNNKINFYDINAKVNYRKSDKDHFYFSAYSGYDKFHFSRITSGYSLGWGNQTASFRWNHVHSPKVFSNTTAVFSNYSYEYQILNNTQYFRWIASLKELNVKQDYEVFASPKNKVAFGWGLEARWINPGAVEPRDEDAVIRHYSLQKQKPISAYLYVGNEQTVGEKMKINYGLRYSNLIIAGAHTRYLFNENSDIPFDSVQYSQNEIEKVYHRFEPRISVNYTSGKHAFNLSYDRTMQYFHLLANSSVGLPTDVWMPSGGSIEPQSADIFAVDYTYPISRKIVGSVGAFYKHTNNILDFKDNANLFVNKYVESQLIQGKGDAYGAELFLQKKGTRLTGTLSYTWSKATTTIAGVNEGKPYPGRYDKRHNLSLTGKLLLSKRWTASFNFVYTTGGVLTVPVGNFMFDNIAFSHYSERNSYRLPDYHRLDVSFRYKPRKNDRRKFQSYWSFDIYNVYSRKNPFTIFSQPQDYGFTQTEMQAVYLFKVVPSISYHFNF